MVEGNIWTALDALSESLHLVFHSLLKCSPEVRHLTLQWFGNCLNANSSRGKLWNAQNEVAMGAVLSVSDGFMLNLATVLLRLCQPFCGKLNDPKVLKIDPTYCATEVRRYRMFYFLFLSRVKLESRKKIKQFFVAVEVRRRKSYERLAYEGNELGNLPDPNTGR